jgi:hypothetical protein
MLKNKLDMKVKENISVVILKAQNWFSISLQPWAHPISLGVEPNGLLHV